MNHTLRQVLAGLLALTLVAGAACFGANSRSPDLEPILNTNPQFPYIPQQAFLTPAAADFQFNQNLGINTSYRHILLVLKDGTSASQFKEILNLSGCVLGGTLPFAGILQLDCGEKFDFERLNGAVIRLKSHPQVGSATYDVELGASSLPPLSAAHTAGWDYNQGHTRSGELSWGLEQIAAPAAWNLMDHLDRRPNAPSLVSVGVLDTGFYPHPDLEGILTLVDGTSYGQGPVIPGLNNYDSNNHGTSVAGIIGANWHNGQYSEGVSPYVTIYGAQVSGSYLSGSLSRILNLTDLTGHLPRVINMSLGDYDWRRKCAPYPLPSGGTVMERCDPRDTGRVPDGLRCPAVDVQRVIADQGFIFGELVDSINQIQETLFVIATGNDSGPMLRPSESYCANPPPNCGNPNQPPCVAAGMGDFPSELSTAYGWAALNHPAGRNIIMVEGLRAGIVPLVSEPVRVHYSNVNGGGVFAPAHHTGAPVKDGTNWTLRPFTGTSAAAPFVTGAAAYLLAIEPSLTNEELRILLTQEPYAVPQDGGGSATSTRIHLLSAMAGIDVLRPHRDPKILTGLADMDDGSPDGFQRVTALPTSVCSNETRTCLLEDPIPYLDDARGDGKVDMKDFRRLRDNYLAQMFSNFDALPDVADHLDNLKLDLNRNGIQDEGVIQMGSGAQIDNFIPSPRGESYPRAGLSGDSIMFTSEYFLSEFLDSVRIFQRAYQGDDLQAWTADALAGLTASADLHVFQSNVANILQALSAQRLDVEIDGTPVRWVSGNNRFLIYDQPPADLSGLRNIHLDGAGNVVLTVPMLNNGELRWRAVCADGSRPSGDPGRTELGELKLAEDQEVNLRLPDCYRDCDGNEYGNCAPPPPPGEGGGGGGPGGGPGGPVGPPSGGSTTFSEITFFWWGSDLTREIRRTTTTPDSDGPAYSQVFTIDYSGGPDGSCVTTLKTRYTQANDPMNPNCGWNVHESQSAGCAVPDTPLVDYPPRCIPNLPAMPVYNNPMGCSGYVSCTGPLCAPDWDLCPPLDLEMPEPPP